MGPDTILYLIWDRLGRIIAFPTKEEAEACLIEDSKHPGLEERPFRFLLENHPKALVHIYHQYCWAEELA